MPLTQQKGEVLQASVSSMDWECAGCDTRYMTHRIHRYSGKFIPQIARQVIELLTEPGEMVLDPYCGSGTTVLEALALGRDAVGIDMNPLAILIARSKCTPISELRVEKLTRTMTVAVQALQKTDGTLFASAESEEREAVYSDPRLTNEWYRKWFSDSALFELIGLHQAVMSLSDDDLRCLALTAFSDILRRCSYAHSGYPNVMYDKRRLTRPQPCPLFIARLREFSSALTKLKLAGSADLREGDACATGLLDNHVDAVITHPPYIGSIPYAEYGALSLTWLGHDPKELDLRLTGGKRQSKDVLERFRAAYGKMITESFRVLKPGKFLFVMVGHPLIKGERVDLSEMTQDFAEKAGFVRAAQTSRTGLNRRANKMGDEDLIFLQKPD